MTSPVYAGENGIRFNPDAMERERLYHCVYRGKAMLVFKDSQDVMNCYEVDDENLTAKIGRCSDDSELESLLDGYVKQLQLND